MILNIFFYFSKKWVSRVMENETFYGDGLSCGAEVDSEGSVEGLSDIHLVILNFTFPLGILRQMKKSLRFV